MNPLQIFQIFKFSKYVCSCADRQLFLLLLYILATFLESFGQKQASSIRNGCILVLKCTRWAHTPLTNSLPFIFHAVFPIYFVLQSLKIKLYVETLIHKLLRVVKWNGSTMRESTIKRHLTPIIMVWSSGQNLFQ